MTTNGSIKSELRRMNAQHGSARARVRDADATHTSAIPIEELTILPFEGVPASVVQALAEALAARGVSPRIDPPVPLPMAAYVPERGQYRAEALLGLATDHRGRYVLALTHGDLFAPGLNFVFGMAEAPGRACVVSAARLLSGADEPLLRARLVKEAVHELGHTLGLDHCADPRCVMHFSNCLADTDRKGDAYCSRCVGRLAQEAGASR